MGGEPVEIRQQPTPRQVQAEDLQLLSGERFTLTVDALVYGQTTTRLATFTPEVDYWLKGWEVSACSFLVSWDVAAFVVALSWAPAFNSLATAVTKKATIFRLWARGPQFYGEKELGKGEVVRLPAGQPVYFWLSYGDSPNNGMTVSIVLHLVPRKEK